MNKFFFLIRILFDIVVNFFTRKEVILISEGMNWVINEECKNMKRFLELNTNISARISMTPTGAKNKIVHFFSVNTLIGKNGLKNETFLRSLHASNKKVLTWFHISDDDAYRLKFISHLNDFIDIVHTASEITKEKLIKNGLNSEKIVVVPLGVDTSIFVPIAPKEKIILRKKLHLPINSIIIGSFQKDGDGWKDGLKPKLIKGPDIFCDVVEKLSKLYNLHILLTGPARGYVKERLSTHHIPYTHVTLKQYADVVTYYQAIDLYLICSREEGGPKALLEAMATGIPLVSTRVGMVPEVIEDEIDGFLCTIEDSNSIFKKASFLIANEKLRKSIAKNALKKIKKFDIFLVEKKLYEVYKKLSTKLDLPV